MKKIYKAFSDCDLDSSPYLSIDVPKNICPDSIQLFVDGLLMHDDDYTLNTSNGTITFFKNSCIAKATVFYDEYCTLSTSNDIIKANSDANLQYINSLVPLNILKETSKNNWEISKNYIAIYNDRIIDHISLEFGVIIAYSHSEFWSINYTDLNIFATKPIF